MAKGLKCWRQVGSRFENKNIDKILVLIIDSTTKTKKYYYELAQKTINGRFMFTGIKFGEKSKSKPQALKFAKSYMRKHDKC